MREDMRDKGKGRQHNLKRLGKFKQKNKGKSTKVKIKSTKKE